MNRGPANLRRRCGAAVCGSPATALLAPTTARCTSRPATRRRLDGAGPPTNFGDCFLQVAAHRGLAWAEADRLRRPSNWKILPAVRAGYGLRRRRHGSWLWRPGVVARRTIIGGGKQGRYYVLDADTMNLTQDTTSPDIQRVGEGFQAFVNRYRNVSADSVDNYAVYATGEGFGPNIHGGPCYWSGPSRIYQMPEKDYLKAFYYDRLSGHVNRTPVEEGNSETAGRNARRAQLTVSQRRCRRHRVDLLPSRRCALWPMDPRSRATSLRSTP